MRKGEKEIEEHNGKGETRYLIHSSYGGGEKLPGTRGLDVRNRRWDGMEGDTGEVRGEGHFRLLNPSFKREI